jgi:hypothetical protein
VLTHRLSIGESRRALEEWLDETGRNTDLGFGKYFRDPALSVLYTDEVKELVEDMKEAIGK